MVQPSSMIAALQEQLVDHPEDPEAYLRLAILYERLGAGQETANDCYLEHLVRTLGYQDAGSAEAGLRRAIERKADDPMTHIHLGMIYGYQGLRRRARIELERGTVWTPIETPHFRLNLIPGSTADSYRDRIPTQREEGLDHACRILGIPYEPSRSIVYFFYESILHKEILTGDGMPAHVFPEEGEVHAVHGPGYHLDGGHEEAHILLRRIGRLPRLVDEGAAGFVHCRGSVHAWCRDLATRAEAPSIVRLIDDEQFEAADPFLSYPIGASFVGFLIETRGAGRFRELVGAACGGIERAIARIYGRDLAALEREWRSFLAACDGPYEGRVAG